MRGTANTCLPFKVLWMRCICVLCRILNKMSDKKKIDNRIYNYFDVLAKGNQFKNKRVLLESIHEIKDVRARERYLKEQTEARKGRDRTRIERKAAR